PRHSTSASRACGGPIVMTTTSPPPRSRSLMASASARRSKGFTTFGTPSRTIVFVFGSNLISETSGTCFMQTMLLIFSETSEHFGSQDSRARGSESNGRSLFLFKFQGSRIHTVAEPRGFGPIIEHVSKMRLASGAHNFDAPHAVARIGLGLDVFFRNGLIETRPTGTRFELGTGDK